MGKPSRSKKCFSQEHYLVYRVKPLCCEEFCHSYHHRQQTLSRVSGERWCRERRRPSAWETFAFTFPSTLASSRLAECEMFTTLRLEDKCWIQQTEMGRGRQTHTVLVCPPFRGGIEWGRLPSVLTPPSICVNLFYIYMIVFNWRKNPYFLSFFNIKKPKDLLLFWQLKTKFLFPASRDLQQMLDSRANELLGS